MGGGSTDEIIMTSTSNPEVMAICYAKGWAAHSDYMTKSEAEAVTSFGTAFNGSQIKTFDETVYFTRITSLANNSFRNANKLQYIWFPYATNYGNQGAVNVCLFLGCSSLVCARFDAITDMAAYNYNYSSMYTVLTMNSVPTRGNWFYGRFYVKDELVNDYKSASGWSGSASNIFSLHQLPTDHPDCPWLDDLRQKGLIPTT